MQTVKPGLERIRRGHDVAFLAGMPWNFMHLGRVLLANCGSHVEAATLSIVLPSANLFCLQPVSGHSIGASNESTDEKQGTRSPLPDWPELVMLMKVHRGQSLDAVHATGGDEWEPVHIELVHAWRHIVPKAFDMVVIPAEGRELLLSLDPVLLLSSQVVVSEGVMERSRIWDTSTPQQQDRSSLNVHMHRSGWEVYAKHSLFPSKELDVRAGPAGGQVKIALHITAMAHYQLIVQQHFSRLIFSGLYDIAEGIYCFILGPTNAEIEAAAAFVQKFGHKIIVAGNSTEMNMYERFTLLGMRAYLQPEDFFLYLHTKGVRRAADSLTIFDWVFYMHYFVVKHFPVCLGLIKEHFDVCGVDYHFPDPDKPWIPSEHYSGNFWWARASYYLSLPESIGAEYLDPEMYIGLKKPRYVALWESNNEMYGTEYPPLEFVDIAATALALPARSASGAKNRRDVSVTPTQL